MAVEKNIGKAVGLTDFLPEKPGVFFPFLFFSSLALCTALVTGKPIYPLSLFLFASAASFSLRRIPRGLPFWFSTLLLPLAFFPEWLSAGLGFLLGFLFLRLFANDTWRPLLLSLIPPLGIFFQGTLPIEGLALSIVAFGIASFLLLVMVDAPAKRVFGISGLELLSLFLSHWFNRDEEIEGVLSEMAEEAVLPVYVLFLKGTRVVIPFFHFGPFSSIGSSDFPRILGLPVLHGPSTHDLDLVTSQEARRVASEILSWKKSPGQPTTLRYLKSKFWDILDFGEFAVAGIDGPEDLTASLGAYLSAHLSGVLGKPVVVFDEHSTDAREIFWVDFGDPEVKKWLEDLKNLEVKWKGPLKVATAHSTRSGPAVGPGGIWVILLGKVCLVVVDGNGMLPSVKRSLEDFLRKKGFYPIVATTDSHVKNLKKGVSNPISTDLREVVGKLLEGLRPVPSGARLERKWMRVRVLGKGQSYSIVLLANFVSGLLKYSLPLLLLLASLTAALGTAL